MANHKTQSDMKRFLLSVAALSILCGSAKAQSFLERLGERAKNAAEQNIGQKVEKGVNDVLDGKIGKKGKKEAEAEKPAVPATPATEPAAQKKPVNTAYAKSDFVPGDEIFFEDDFAGEQMGEFPSRWDLISGYAEVGSIEGRKIIAFTDDGSGAVIPLMKEPRSFLPDVFTLEYDIFLGTPGDYEDERESGSNNLILVFASADDENKSSNIDFYYRGDGSSSLSWSVLKPDGASTIQGKKEMGLNDGLTDYNGKDNPLKPGDWNHFAFSFNKRALKGYVNGQRVINIPLALAPQCFWFSHSGNYIYSGISNVRLAQGAVPLYDRLSSEGKIITYAITFEIGKADLKPESMVEINRIAKLMQENPNLAFEVQGHCDSSGSDKVNDPLSQKRAEAIVAALVEEGIAESRLTPVGKGSHEPIASNSTEEGRAKNRRVEFVKK
jgi:outer membrane protein OmpA-like peptidoglycan-associated protein